MKFVNKLRYAKEGARVIMDRTCADLPWQVWLEVDGKDIEIPKVLLSHGIFYFYFNFCYRCYLLYVYKLHLYLFFYFMFLFDQDSECLIILNISSYMGGVDLWQNDLEHADKFSLQSMHDKMLEVVSVCGAWHLGKLQVYINFVFSFTKRNLEHFHAPVSLFTWKERASGAMCPLLFIHNYVYK